jgi:hypothetical protein
MIRALLLALALASAAYGQQVAPQTEQHRGDVPGTKVETENPAVIKAPQLNPELKQRLDDLEETVFGGLYTAEVHVRYHSNQASIYWWADLIAKITISLLSVAAFCGPFVFPTKPKWVDYVWRAAGLGVLLFALWMSYLSFGDWYREQSLLADSWQELATEWKDLELRRPKLSETEVMDDIAKFEVRSAEITKESPKAYSSWMLSRAMEQQNRYLGIDTGWSMEQFAMVAGLLLVPAAVVFIVTRAVYRPRQPLSS